MIIPILMATTVSVAAPTAPVASSLPAAAANKEIAERDPMVLAARTARWQLDQLKKEVPGSEGANPQGWVQAAFWIGMTEFADAGGPPEIRNAIVAHGQANEWKPAARRFNADDVAITDMYIWEARHGAAPNILSATRKRFDDIIDNTPRVGLAFYATPGKPGDIECLPRWCWSDALFMAPPAMAALFHVTGEKKYLSFMSKQYWLTVDFLFDPAENLFYRDSRFFSMRGAEGRKIFWSRGNGWVFAGLARTMRWLPKGSPDRERMETLFIDMANKLISLQKPDGYWSPSLLDTEGSVTETSGTAFFTYGLAWGVANGILPRARFEPAARRGWAALVKAIQPDGRLGWVQPIGDQPNKVSPSDSTAYGTGGFLMAASAMHLLDNQKSAN